MKKIITIALVVILLSGCTPPAKTKQFQKTYYDLFDTVTTVIGYGASEEEFLIHVQVIYEDLLYYHRLFDIYNSYEGICNLKTVNDLSGTSPVKVDKAILELIADCKKYNEISKGKVNAAMGSVLRQWHIARNAGIVNPSQAVLPAMESLLDASGHMNMEDVIIDFEASTICFQDEKLQLDVGAIAKGWAVQKVAENAPEGMLISVGGNVYVTGPKTVKGDSWVIGIQDPDQANRNLHKLGITHGCVVTSGDYQRGYTVDSVYYHHIIDPDTLMPGTLWRSVTIVCDDSGLADAFSTAFFLLPLEEGKALAEAYGVEAMWLDTSGNEYFTDGFAKMIIQ